MLASKNKLRKFIGRLSGVVLVLYLGVCTLLYIFQEKLIFFPEKLDKHHTFIFGQSYEELYIKTLDGAQLNALLFKADSSKGLIFYLHGNAGSLNSWGKVASTYTDLNYDVCILDYRSYGKSEGEISSQDQFYTDIQCVYNQIKTQYKEQDLIVLGYSIGTGPAAFLASKNNPKRLILQAPYYSLTDMMKQNFGFIPTFILKYKFDTHEYLKHCKMPVTIFHGNRDEVIQYSSSLKLKETFKSGDTIITLEGQGHNGMTDNPDYQEELEVLLSK
jgi:pimeloyl-ACP methyl ester carboxylesterase